MSSIGPRLIEPGSAADPLVAVRSDFWNFNGLGFYDGEEACVIDPGIRREDIELLGTRLRWAGGRTSPRRITKVLVTHSHHDHFRGWDSFPGAEVILPRVAADKAATPRRRILAAKSAVDDRLGEVHEGFRYPNAYPIFDERLSLQVGSREVELRFLPGHSDCTSVVWIPSLRTLCTADYLVSPGLPYCRWDADAFDAALDTLTRWTQEEGIERVWPAHNAPILGNAAILAAIDADRRVMQALRERAHEVHASGLDGLEAARAVSENMDGVRGWEAGVQRRQDVDNARRVLAAVAASSA
ncbi:MAG: glyoxylase-like metal-dependent hydrolase (beta-lactamase superfamily II) [Planctomycetota bacterium]|jgi:glyoxylase-like metal-dependent hydrolase (beta-lactamase superfamily II)